MKKAERNGRAHVKKNQEWDQKELKARVKSDINEKMAAGSPARDDGKVEKFGFLGFHFSYQIINRFCLSEVSKVLSHCLRGISTRLL
tara:strand:+ start:175 stop:435 length:261 start_codon:yes stop_codon:yes gene_type:complete